MKLATLLCTSLLFAACDQSPLAPTAAPTLTGQYAGAGFTLSLSQADAGHVAGKLRNADGLTGTVAITLHEDGYANLDVDLTRGACHVATPNLKGRFLASEARWTMYVIGDRADCLPTKPAVEMVLIRQ